MIDLWPVAGLVAAGLGWDAWRRHLAFRAGERDAKVAAVGEQVAALQKSVDASTERVRERLEVHGKATSAFLQQVRDTFVEVDRTRQQSRAQTAGGVALPGMARRGGS